LINLESLTLSHNKIEYIELHGFNGLNNLKFLSLNNNKLKTLQINNQSIFENLVNLNELHLEANQLNSIQSSYFLPLKRLEILNIKSDMTRIVEPNSFDSFPHLRRLFISIPNISNENIFNIKNSLKPVVIRSYVLWKYYSVAHIENRVNIDCSKTLYFMKSKILYNFFNEHIDINDFLSNCMNLSEIRNKLNYLENSTLHRNEEIFQFYLKDYFIPSYTPVLLLFILMAVYVLTLIAYMILKEAKKKYFENQENFVNIKH
jgi:Leucine-rich repeat (LRR) protein